MNEKAAVKLLLKIEKLPAEIEYLPDFRRNYFSIFSVILKTSST
jgi:hypothetical protein